ncbi:MAG: hypothetical protein R3C03_01565 [Pirellulaceae bacterium]
MKIEFTCNNCNSVLRLPAENVGKKARCPVCGNISVVAEKSESSDSLTPNYLEETTGYENDPPHYSQPNQPEAHNYGPSSGNHTDNPYSAPVSPNPGQNYHGQFAAPPTDALGITSIILGSIAVVTSCGCGVCGVFTSSPVAIVGLILAIISRSPNKWIGIALNGLALLIGFSFIAIAVMFQAF